MNSTVSSKSTEAKQIARQEIEQILPQNRRNDLCLGFCPHSSSMVDTNNFYQNEMKRGFRYLLLNFNDKNWGKLGLS